MLLFCRFFFSQNVHPKPQNNTPRNTPINTSDPPAIGRLPVAVFAVWPVSGVRFAVGGGSMSACCLSIRHGFPLIVFKLEPVAASWILFGGSPMCCRWWSTGMAKAAGVGFAGGLWCAVCAGGYWFIRWGMIRVSSWPCWVVVV